MRILLVTQYFWPESFPINDIVLGLKDEGHQIEVLTGMPNYPGGRIFHGYSLSSPKHDSFEGVHVGRAPLIPRGNGAGWRLALNFLSLAASGCLLGPRRCPGPFDAILVYQPSPVTIGLPAVRMKRKTGAPILFWVQDLWPETLAATGAVSSRIVLGWVGSMVRYIYRRCDLVLVQSEAFIGSIESHGVPRERIKYLPNTAEALYRPVERRRALAEELGLPSGLRIMFAGNIGAAQDFPAILGAATHLKEQKDIHWLIVGDGRQRNWVEQEVEKRGLGGTFHLLGKHPKERMPEFFAHADVMLVTLKPEPIFALTIPSKVQPYMACGKPILAGLDGEGARVIRESGAGIAVPAGDSKELAEGVVAFHRMAEAERQAMGRKSREYFEAQFSRERLLEKLQEWMAEVRT